MTRTTIPDFKLFLNQIYNSSSFYIKSLDCFQDMKCQVFHFQTYPEFETLLRYRDKTHFLVFE